MEELYFREMTLDDEDLIKAYLREFVEAGSEINGFGGVSSVSCFKSLYERQQKNKNLPFISYEQEERVPQITYLLVRKFDERIVGTFNIRFYLNRFLDETLSGHIGYGVRPSERRKGYATEGLKMALEIFRKRGAKTVRLGCYSDNTGSKKTILKNGGKLIKHNEALISNDYYEIDL